MKRVLSIQSVFICAMLLMPMSASQASTLGGIAGGLKRAIEKTHILEGRPTLAPFAFVKFCRDNPEDCKFEGQGSLDLDHRSYSELRRINRHVNSTILPTAEVGDVWSVNVAKGDCEDYVLTKRRSLVQQGFPPAALRIAVAKTPAGVGHAVLVVKTKKADLVLDNRTDSIREWSRTDLKWLKIQSGDNAYLWRSL